MARDMENKKTYRVRFRFVSEGMVSVTAHTAQEARQIARLGCGATLNIHTNDTRIIDGECDPCLDMCTGRINIITV